MAIVYRHIRLDKNEPFYIGVGVDKRRAYQVIQRSKYWKSIVNKTEYEIEILFDDLTYEQAKEKEKEFIALYGRKDLGTGTLVNMTDGGEGCLNPSIQRRRAQSELMKNHIKSAATRKKLSEKLKGRKFSDETRRKMSEGQKNKSYKPTEEHKRKISEGGKGLKRSEETRKKMSESAKNRSEEHRRKISEANKGKKRSKK